MSSWQALTLQDEYGSKRQVVGFTQGRHVHMGNLGSRLGYRAWRGIRDTCPFTCCLPSKQDDVGCRNYALFHTWQFSLAGTARLGMSSLLMQPGSSRQHEMKEDNASCPAVLPSKKPSECKAPTPGSPSSCRFHGQVCRVGE